MHELCSEDREVVEKVLEDDGDRGLKQLQTCLIVQYILVCAPEENACL